MQHLLRAISGPLAGAVYVLGSRTTLGRASDCDIQVLHEGVSRQHAKISPDAQGDMILTDLSSDNGTFVEGERISRHRLEPGDAVRIMTSQFVYEMLDAPELTTSAVFERKVTSGDSLRQTANHREALSGFRSGSGRSSPDGFERGSGYQSRPQAVAPAPSGARPGAAVAAGPPRLTGIYTRAPTQQMAVPADELVAEPPPPDDPGQDAAEPSDEQSPTARTIGYGEARMFPFTRPPADDGTSSSYGWHARSTGQRERVTITPASLARAVTPPPEGPPTPDPPASDVSTTPGVRSDRPAVASPPQRSSSGRSRTAPPTTPGSMRPRRSTVTGLPQAEIEPAPSLSQAPSGPSRAEPTPVAHTGRWYARPPAPEASVVRAPAPASEASRHQSITITSEYGAMGDGETPPESTAAVDSVPLGTASAGVATAERDPSWWRDDAGPAARSLESDDHDDDDHEAHEKTVPRVRRTASSPVGGQRPFQPDPEPVGDSDDSTEDTLRVGRRRRAAPERADSLDAGRPPLSAAPSSERLDEDLGEHSEKTERTERTERTEARDQGLIDTAEPADDPHAGLETLVDILEYRDLRLRSLRGETLGAQAVDRYSALERQLQQQLATDDRAAMRRYHRYLCALPAQLVQRRDDATVGTLDVELADISAGGAKLVCGNGSLGPGDVVWLTVDLAQADCSRLPEPDADLVVLASRVVWARPLDAEVGIIFAGAPRFERGLAPGR